MINPKKITTKTITTETVTSKIKTNKAGYTANISRGRVGRGGNACFPTFRLERDGATDQPTDGRTDGRTKPLIESLVRE